MSTKARVAVETLNGKWADFAAFYGGTPTEQMDRAVEFAVVFVAKEVPVRIIVEPDSEEDPR